MRLVGEVRLADRRRHRKRADGSQPGPEAATTNGAGAPRRWSRPAATGPAIVPNCHTDAFMAITRGSSSAGTLAASIGV